jgi:hypothetical protein
MSEQLPLILYKYRDWENENHKRILTEKELFFSASKNFNDPFDTMIPLIYKEEDLTDENILRKLYEVGKETFPELSDMELYTKCTERFFEIKENGFFEVEDPEREENNNLFGILSLTCLNDNLLMWAHYANSHKGFCIGFNIEKLKSLEEGIVVEVIYDNKMPIMPLFNDIKDYIKLLITKSLDWKYEKEYRILKSYYSNKTINFSSDIVENIVLGLNMKESYKKEIISIIKRDFPGTRIFEARKNKSEFKLDLIPIK